MLRSILIAMLLLAAPVLAEEAGGLKWQAPASWKTDPPRPMRAATYRIPAAKGDPEGAELAVFYFGPGQGGGVQANVDRWIGQFEQPDGKPSRERAKTSTEKLNGRAVTRVSVGGTYTGAAGPMMAPGSGAKKPGYRLEGAIVEGPQGAVFFKLTGPEKTVKAAEKDFKALLSSIE